MIGTCSIPTGQISTHAMHCMHDHTVSGLIGLPSRFSSDAKSGGTVSQPRMPNVPSDCSRRSSTRSRGDSGYPEAAAGQASWHLPHFVHASSWSRWAGARSVDDAVADVLRLRARGQPDEALPGHVVPRCDAGGSGHHVHRLRERDRRHERERCDAVDPPVAEMRGRRGLAVDADRDQALARRASRPEPISRTTGSVSAIRRASRKNPVTPRKRSEPTKTQSPTW